MRRAYLYDSTDRLVIELQVPTDPEVPHGILWGGRYFFFYRRMWCESEGSYLVYREGILWDGSVDPSRDR